MRISNRDSTVEGRASTGKGHAVNGTVGVGGRVCSAIVCSQETIIVKAAAAVSKGDESCIGAQRTIAARGIAGAAISPVVRLDSDAGLFMGQVHGVYKGGACVLLSIEPGGGGNTAVLCMNQNNVAS